MIGKIKPTITIGAEVQLIFSEFEFIECTSLILANLNGYEILIGNLSTIRTFAGSRVIWSFLTGRLWKR
jgi:hypothetical protein